MDLTFALDTGALQWWQNGEWFIYLLADAGDNPSDLTGDVQGISNIAAPRAARIYEFWYRHSFAEGDVNVLLGLHDFNSAFYSLESAGLFTHASFGIGPDVSQVVPSIFPVTSLGLVVAGEHQSLYWQTAVYDGVPGDPDNPRGTHVQLGGDDGVFAAVEWGFQQAELYKAGVGYWYHTAAFETPADSRSLDDNSGIYFIGERYFGAGWAAFVQTGLARDRVNLINQYLGCGLSFSGALVESDSLGFAVAQVKADKRWRSENPQQKALERAWELTYRFPVTDFLALQGNLYYIENPGFDTSLDNAVAAGLRVYIDI